MDKVVATAADITDGSSRRRRLRPPPHRAETAFGKQPFGGRQGCKRRLDFNWLRRFGASGWPFSGRRLSPGGGDRCHDGLFLFGERAQLVPGNFS